MTSQRTNPWTEGQQRQHVRDLPQLYDIAMPQSYGSDLYHEDYGYSLIGVLSHLSGVGGWTYDSKHKMWGYNNVKIILSRDVQEYYGFRTVHGCDVREHTLTYLQEVYTFYHIIRHYLLSKPLIYFTWAGTW